MYPFISTVLTAVKDYKPFAGMLRSEFVGADNFLRFFSYKYFSRLLINTVVPNALAVLIGAVCVFVSTLAVGSVKNIFAKSITAFLFALPLAIPADIAVHMISEFVPLYESGRHLWVISAIGNALPLAALFSLGALLVKGSPVKSALKLTGAFAAVKLVLLMVENFGFQYLITSPATYEYTETMSTYIYTQGLQSNAFSYGSAVGIINVLLNLIPAAVGCVIIAKLMKSEHSVTDETNSTSPTVFAAIAAIIPVVITVLAVASVWGTELRFDVLGKNYANSFIIAVAVTVIAAALVFSISHAAASLRTVGIVVMCVLCLMIENRIGQYITARWLGCVNTHIGVIIMNLRIVPAVALIFAIFIKMRDSLGSRLAVLPLSAGAVFAFAWGDITAPLVLLNDGMKYPISIMARQIFAANGMIKAAGQVSVNFSPYALVPVIVLAICVAAGGLLMRAYDKKE